MEINFKKHTNKSGELIVIDYINGAPFVVNRTFYIKNLTDISRGHHAHRVCEEIIIPIQGSFILSLTDKTLRTEKFYLDNDCVGIRVPPLTWLVMKNFSHDCIILVLASHKHDETECIRDYQQFLEEIKPVKEIIKFCDLREQNKNIKVQVMNKIEQVIDSSSFVIGKELSEFEENFARYNNIKYCVGTSNGTSALKCAIKAIQHQEKNIELIYQANTYVSVPLCAQELNLKSHVLDTDQNLQLSLYELEKFLRENKEDDTKYIVVIVHLYGYSVDMLKLINLKEKYNFYLIEDAAQAHGATYNDKKLGTFGDIGCFSFYPSKNLGSFGEGGAIITNNIDYYNYIKMYRNYGTSEKNNWQLVGSNERMHTLQAAILNIKLNYLDEYNNNRKNLASIYHKNLNISQISIPDTGECNAVYHVFIVIAKQRDMLKKFLEENNVECNIHYSKPFYEREAYLENFKFEIFDTLKYNILSLPMYPELAVEDVNKICNLIKKFYQ